MHKKSAKSQALSHAAAVVAFQDQLEQELAWSKVDHDTVKSLNAKIGVGLKLAQVYAILAVEEALAPPAGVIRIDGDVDEDTAAAVKAHFTEGRRR